MQQNKNAFLCRILCMLFCSFPFKFLFCGENSKSWHFPQIAYVLFRFIDIKIYAFISRYITQVKWNRKIIVWIQIKHFLFAVNNEPNLLKDNMFIEQWSKRYMCCFCAKWIFRTQILMNSEWGGMPRNRPKNFRKNGIESQTSNELNESYISSCGPRVADFSRIDDSIVPE